MNQLCKVCGEPAAGFHFGAFTCEGCKSFFGRTYNNISAISGCKNNGDCVINKKNRTACKACRLRKCLLVGMSKSGSRYGRRSNWFKIHCLLQEQQQQQQQQSGNSNQQQTNCGNNQQQQQQQQTSSSPSSNQSSISTIFDQFNITHQQLHQAKQTYQDKTNPSIIKTEHHHHQISSTTAGNILCNHHPFLPVQQLLKQKHNNNNNNNINNNNNNTKNIISNSCNKKQFCADEMKISLENCLENSEKLNGNRQQDNCDDDDDDIVDSNGKSSHSESSISGDEILMDSKRTESIKFMKFNSIEQSTKLFPFNGHHQQNNQYSSFHHHHHHHPFITTTFQHIPIPSALLTNKIASTSTTTTATDIQNEPIDLSIKSIKSNTLYRCISPSDAPLSPTSLSSNAAITSSSSSVTNLELLSKPAPLDLTLVRSPQPMSG